jgi:aspartate/methionine/tyrosine aminotransferase
VDPSAVVITASTSESYSLLAKLLCQPGEGFLVPQPSYPLFEHLLRLEGCQAFPYPLPEESGFHLEAAALPCLAQAKAVVVVQPNNPTGTVIAPGQGEALVARCAAQGQALIADEVFWEYPLSPFPRQSLVGNGGCLTFTLGGLSKLVGLPQLKLGWMVVSGPQDLVEQAMTRLEFLADTYLSVSTPLQQALGEILARAWPVHQAIAQRIRENLQLLRRLVASYPFLQLLPPEGGWSAVLRFPRLCSEEELVLELLEGEGVACYPGYFFDFPGEGYVVVSLLVRPETLTQGIGHLAEKLVSKGAGPKGGLSP